MLFLLGVIITASLATILPDANISLFLYDKIASPNVYKSKFNNKRIWITGASSGIGEEIAKQLYSHGAKVILSGRRGDELYRVRQLCLDLADCDIRTDDNSCDDKNIQILPFDLVDGENISNIVTTAIDYYQGIDILILNAGIGQLSPTIGESLDTTRYLMDVNFHSQAQLALEVIKQDKWGSIDQETKQKRNGHIVLTSSVASKLPLPLGSSYAASKHAAHGYFSSLRSECSSWLRVDLPCPGPISTKFQNKAVSNGKILDNNSNLSETSNETRSDDGGEVKMAADRCAKLIIAGMSGPRFFMEETWISKQPTLLFMYLNQVFPTLSNALLGIIGSLRLKAFDAGLPLYKVSSWIKVAKMKQNE